MSERDGTAVAGGGRPVGRRRVLKVVGASGLATAAALFGRTPAASAGTEHGCCVLATAKHKSWSYCAARATYIWSCTHTVSMWCRCCEMRGYSAYTCQYN